ncbi:tyrosine-protein phosphatase non-receptor type 9-like [Babylonia areolata]|uniref:tyrosine-protein phosphatase non-receptor type 9-like n=1 Tax=Babylonia areolata TaxID=304850 RepID=UPI003FD287BF
MAALLTTDEETVVQQFLEAVNRERVAHHQGAVTWGQAIKFLMARKFDLKRACDLFFAHENTREQEDLQFIDPSDRQLQREVNTEKFTVLPGRDRSGAGLALFTARLHHPPQTTHQVVLKGLIYQLDAALESFDTQRNGLVFIYDMTDSKYANFDYDLSIKILSLLKGAYPARLKRVLIVTAPLWFKAPFKILRLFVKAKLRERVYTVSLQELNQYVPKELLPKTLGGNQASVHPVWLQLCREVATGLHPDMDTYFMAPKAPTASSSRGSCSSVTPSFSSDTDQFISDFDSVSSKDTVHEKHNHEDREKEKGDWDHKDDLNSKKRRSSTSRRNSESRKRSSESGTLDHHHHHHHNHAHEPPSSESLPRKKRPLSSGSNILDDSIHMPESTGLTLDMLVEHVRTVKKKGLFNEYAHIRMEPHAGTFNHSRARHNLPKNRYTDVLCYDHSRVMLPIIDGDPTSDYINANYVDGYMQKNAYICTQGPLPKTFVDFWRMIWHQQCQVIVMTTRTIERQRMKCGQYWPNEEHTDEQFEEFIVYNNSVQSVNSYNETKLILHNTNTGETREITHLQFTTWPDYGVPPATGFLDFLFHVRAVQERATRSMGSAWTGHPLGPPIVVHCSAGIGRTGTFITMDISLRRLEDVGTVDIPATVRRIRSQRAFSIQMPDQYVFCHLGLVEHALRCGLLPDKEPLVLEDSESESD